MFAFVFEAELFVFEFTNPAFVPLLALPPCNTDSVQTTKELFSCFVFSCCALRQEADPRADRSMRKRGRITRIRGHEPRTAIMRITAPQHRPPRIYQTRSIEVITEITRNTPTTFKWN